MSTTATARSLVPAEEPAKQALPPSEAVDSRETQNADDLKGIDRLLTALESRSLAIVPYGQYAHLREVPEPKANNRMLAAGLVAVWLSIMVFGVAYMRYASRGSVADREPVSRPIVIPSPADQQEQKVASTVDHLAKELATSAQRINQLEAALQKSNTDAQKAAAKAVSEQRPLPLTKPVSTPAAQEAAKTADVDLEPSAPSVPRNWHRVVSIKPTENAVAHHAPDGSIDYWQVPRAAGSSELGKVLPIGSSVEGVVVHCLDDGKDYTITPSGEWRSGSLPDNASR